MNSGRVKAHGTPPRHTRLLSRNKGIEMRKKKRLGSEMRLKYLPLTVRSPEPTCCFENSNFNDQKKNFPIKK